MLEAFAERAMHEDLKASRINLPEAWDLRDEDAEDVVPSFPELDDYPPDADWRDLEPSLTGRCLSFPIEVQHAISDCAEALQIDDELWLKHMRFHLPRRSRRADELANELRRRYHLPPQSLADQAADYSDDEG